MLKASSNLSPTLVSAVQVRAAAAPVGGRVDGGGQGDVGVHGVRGDRGTPPPESAQPQKLCTANFSSGTLKTLINRPLRLKNKIF